MKSFWSSTRFLKVTKSFINMTDFSAALHFSASFFEYRTRWTTTVFSETKGVSKDFYYFYAKKNTIFNDQIKEIVENADMHLKTTKIVLQILSYKRSPRIKQTWNYKNERLQCWNQQYIPARTLDFEYSNTRSLLTGYKVINWPELFFQLAALSTYGTFPIRRFLSVLASFTSFLLILRQVSWNHRGHISHPIVKKWEAPN